jgi:hypothetical protein
MSYMRDGDFQENLLVPACKDRNFLKRMSGILSEKDFTPRKGEGMQEAYWVSQIAFKYWRDYREPIGGMLRTFALDFIREQGKHIGRKQKDKLIELVERIRSKTPVAVEAIEKKVLDYKRRKNKTNAIKELINLQEKGELSDSRFRRICRDALETYDNSLKVSNFTSEGEVDKRIKRREKRASKRFPFLMIEQFDKRAHTFDRGQFGIILAKYNVGKSTAAVFLAQVYALQGYNALIFTLEDSMDMVEDRLDASFAGIKMYRLVDYSTKLKRRLRRKLKKLRAHIRIVDGTDGGMTVGRMEEVWETYRNQGFAADVVIVDADEGITPVEHYKGDSGERREIGEIYRDLKSFFARRSVWGWVMAQAKRGKSGVRKMVVTGDDAADDIRKLRKCALCIGIGDGPEEFGEDGKYLFVAKHKHGPPKWGFPFMGDFERATFYDSEATIKAVRNMNHNKD